MHKVVRKTVLVSCRQTFCQYLHCCWSTSVEQSTTSSPWLWTIAFRVSPVTENAFVRLKIAAPSNLLLDVVRLINVLTYLLTYLLHCWGRSDEFWVTVGTVIMTADYHTDLVHGLMLGLLLYSPTMSTAQPERPGASIGYRSPCLVGKVPPGVNWADHPAHMGCIMLV